MAEEHIERIHPDVPQESFDEILFSLLTDWNPRGLVLEIPGLYLIVAEYFKDQIIYQWRQELMGPVAGFQTRTTTESEKDPQGSDREDHEWCCQVCDEDLPSGSCPRHPYAGVYDGLGPFEYED